MLAGDEQADARAGLCLVAEAKARAGATERSKAIAPESAGDHVSSECRGCDRLHARLSALAGVVRVVQDDSGMRQNFIAADRGQVLLLPPSLADWLPEEHFVWTVLGAVEQMDLGGFYGAYRANGQGRAAYDPAVMP